MSDRPGKQKLKPRFTAAFLLITVVMLNLAGISVRGFCQELDISAPSAVLMDALSGQVIWEKNPHEVRAPASITKIMTLMVIFDAIREGRVNPSDLVTASEHAWMMGGSQVYTEPGETFPLSEWILAIAVGSANDACVVAAEHIAGSEKEFVDLMNKKAREIGLKNTTFVNCHGLDAEGHVTTAYDVALMSKYAATYPEILEVTKIYQAKFRKGTFGLDNANKLLVRYQGVDGLKTGLTDRAGYCVAATAVRGSTRLIAVIMGAATSEDRFRDATRLFNYGFANYGTVKLAEKGDVITRVRVWGGTEETVELVAHDVGAVTLKKGEEKGISKKIRVNEGVVAPVRKGDQLGDLVVLKDDKEILKIPIVAAKDVPRLSPMGLFWKIWTNMVWIDDFGSTQKGGASSPARGD